MGEKIIYRQIVVTCERNEGKNEKEATQGIPAVGALFSILILFGGRLIS